MVATHISNTGISSLTAAGPLPVHTCRRFAAILSLGVAVLGLSACGSGKGAQSGPGGLVSIKVAGGEGAAALTPFFAAIKQGFFKDAGLDVTYVTLAGGATSMDAALASHEIDVGIGGATQWLSDYAKGAIKGKIIGEIADNNYVILGGEGITDVHQLKGKIFGVSNYNAGDHLYSKAVLSASGVAPDDVTWIAIGNPGGRLAALRAGRIAATEMPMTNLPASENKRILIGADNSPFPFVSNAIFAREGMLAENKPALQKFLGAIGKAADWVKAHPAEAIPSCLDSGATIDICKSAIAVASASRNPYTWSSTARADLPAITTMIPVIAAVVPQAKTLKATDVVDTSVAGKGA